MRLQVFFIVLAIVVPIINGFNNPRKLEDDMPDLDNKCGGCPCNIPCVQGPPPPLPSPPPPSPPPPAPKPPSNNCPPPPPTCGSCNNPSVPSPPSQYMYVTGGPPGNLYPVDAYYNRAGQEYIVGLPLLFGCMLLGLQVLLF